MTRTTAEQIVKVIVADLTGRRGLRQEWENIDDDIQEEIRNKWVSIVFDQANKESGA